MGHRTTKQILARGASNPRAKIWARRGSSSHCPPTQPSHPPARPCTHPWTLTSPPLRHAGYPWYKLSHPWEVFFFWLRDSPLGRQHDVGVIVTIQTTDLPPPQLSFCKAIAHELFHSHFLPPNMESTSQRNVLHLPAPAMVQSTAPMNHTSWGNG